MEESRGAWTGVKQGEPSGKGPQERLWATEPELAGPCPYWIFILGPVKALQGL